MCSNLCTPCACQPSLAHVGVPRHTLCCRAWPGSPAARHTGVGQGPHGRGQARLPRGGGRRAEEVRCALVTCRACGSNACNAHIFRPSGHTLAAAYALGARARLHEHPSRGIMLFVLPVPGFRAESRAAFGTHAAASGSSHCPSTAASSRCCRWGPLRCGAPGSLRYKGRLLDAAHLPQGEMQRAQVKLLRMQQSFEA